MKLGLREIDTEKYSLENYDILHIFIMYMYVDIIYMYFI